MWPQRSSSTPLTDEALGPTAEWLSLYEAGDASALRNLIPWATSQQQAEREAQELSQRVAGIRHRERQRAFLAPSRRRVLPVRVPCRTARPRARRPRSCRASTGSGARGGDPPPAGEDDHHHVVGPPAAVGS